MTVNEKYLNGLAARTERELREAEDALVEHIAASTQRERLYDSTTSDLADRYPALNAGR